MGFFLLWNWLWGTTIKLKEMGIMGLKKGICRAWIDNFTCEQISLDKFQNHSSVRSCSFVLNAQFILSISLNF